MNNDQKKPGGTPETELRSAEAQLFSEILKRMDEQDRRRQAEQSRAKEQEGQTIDLVELFFFLLSKLHYIVLGMVLGGVLLGFYASSRVVPIYTATSKLFIRGQTGMSIISDLQIGTVLTLDYQEVFKTWEVHEMVNEQLGTNFSYSKLQSMLTVTNPEDTRVMYITIRDTDAQRAADIANAYGTAAKRFITETMFTDEPSTFSVALVPSTASSISVTNYVIRGILVGTVLAGGILVLVFLLDNRPKSPEDIMRCANIPTLAVIPMNPELSGDKKHRRKARKS
ncbi:MAG: YveK family protein [Aristaeellaceae bacterium]